MTVPATVTRATVEAELAAAVAWAGRHGWVIVWSEETMTLRVATYHPTVRRIVELVADLDGYPALPPAWRCVVPGTDDSPSGAWPSPGQQPGVSGSVFHTNPCICAPWNQLAYRVNNGPHDDWAMTSWQSIGGDWTHANRLADMLDQIHQHLHVSPGFQG